MLRRHLAGGADQGGVDRRSSRASRNRKETSSPEAQVDHFHATCAGCSPRTRLQLGQGDRDLEVDRLEMVAIEATAGFEAVVVLRP